MPPAIAVTAVVFVAPAATAAATIIVVVVVIAIAVDAVLPPLLPSSHHHCCYCCHHHCPPVLLPLLVGCCVVHEGLIRVPIVASSLPPQGLFLLIVIIAVATALGAGACPPLPSSCLLSTAGLPRITCLTLSATRSSLVVSRPPLLSCCPSPRLPCAVHHPPSLCYPTPACHPSYLSPFDCCVHYPSRMWLQ